MTRRRSSIVDRQTATEISPETRPPAVLGPRSKYFLNLSGDPAPGRPRSSAETFLNLSGDPAPGRPRPPAEVSNAPVDRRKDFLQVPALMVKF